MDDRLAQVEKEKQEALNQSNDAYGSMLQNNEDLYNQQNSYAEQYEQSQNEMLDKQLQYNEGIINQQKDIARQNMKAEQKRAKNDYQAYVNPYGNQAESFASRGLLNSGVSETAKLGGYNTYQNRLATANKVMQDAFVQYDNDMNQARLNNDVQKAQNALKKLEMQLQYSENYYNNKNTLTQNQLTNNQSLDSEYYNRYNTEYNNIQEEKAREEAIRQWEAQMAEQQRQFNEQMAYQKARDAVADQQWKQQYELSKKSVSTKTSSSSSLSGSSSSSSKSSSTQSLQNTQSNTQKFKAVRSVNQWFDSQLTDKQFKEGLTADELSEILAKGMSQGKLTQTDVNNIYKSYGLSNTTFGSSWVDKVAQLAKNLFAKK